MSDSVAFRTSETHETLRSIRLQDHVHPPKQDPAPIISHPPRPPPAPSSHSSTFCLSGWFVEVQSHSVAFCEWLLSLRFLPGGAGVSTPPCSQWVWPSPGPWPAQPRPRVSTSQPHARTRHTQASIS